MVYCSCQERTGTGLDKKSRRKITRDFIALYGSARLRALLKDLSKGESGQMLAEEFRVSRERIRQWKETFGKLHFTYKIFPEVIDELNKNRRGDPDPTFVL